MTEPLAHIYHLALRAVHAGAGATFAEREGWSLPAHYGDPAVEHAALRASAVVFDRSQRSRFLVSGTDALDVLAKVFQGYPSELDEGRSMRTVALDDAGNVRDLVLIARTGGIAYLASGEAGQRFETLERLRAAREEDFDARIEDRSESTCLVGVAGPGAADIVREHLSDALPTRLQPLHCVTFEFHGFRSLAIRTSDTGEDGFEFMVAPAVAQHMIETLRAGGVPLAGDIAQQVARVEACVPAFDPDLQTGLSPAEADLDVLLGIPGGRSARILGALLIESAAPLPAGTPITANGATVGELRSCVRSFGLNATIGLGVIDARAATPGHEFDVAGMSAALVAKPFLRRRHQG